MTDPALHQRVRQTVEKTAAWDWTRDIKLEVPDDLSVRQGQSLVIRGRITNTGQSVWPAVVDGHELAVGFELYYGSHETRIVALRQRIEKPALRPGDYVDFEFAASTAAAAVGPAQVRVDLLYERLFWFHWKGGSVPQADLTVMPCLTFESIDEAARVESPVFWQQHVPEYSATTEIGITTPAFQDYVIPTSAGDIQAKSMLTMDEIALLYALARYHYRGIGKIVDLGPLLGIGTHVMARGVTLNGWVSQKRAAIYSYDLFLAENMMHFLPGSDDSGTGSVFWRFLEINRDYLDIVKPVPGDFLTMRWIDAPIEILFVDLSKSWALNRHVLRHFFPRLIPGHSIVIQQDYVHVGEPWIALTMELLAEYFEPLYFIYGCSAVYRLVKPIPHALLDLDLAALPLSETDRLFEQARAKAQPTVAEVLKCCQAAVRIEKGDLAGAEALLADVNPDMRDAEDIVPAQEFSRAIPQNLAVVRVWLRHAQAQAQAAGSNAA
jgi:hypothetical protein